MEKNNKSCRWCRQEIKKEAKICAHCGNSQNIVIYHLNTSSIFVSILLLILAWLQFNAARQENIKASDALKAAQETELRIGNASKAMAKCILAVSALDNTYNSFAVLKFFPPVLKHEAEALLNSVEISDTERKKIYRLRNLLLEWIGKSGSNESDLSDLEEEILSLINNDDNKSLKRDGLEAAP